ncbi:MAG TPA: alpha/beta hydrolase [candidate division Zixibacteria bacterium]|nr:alpha/beta hydrolase [candidate division Zixibacteria bacterium]
MRDTRKFITHILPLLISALLILIGLACSGDKTPTAAIKIGVDSLTTDDGVNIKYEVHSLGDTTLLFVHCWMCDRHFWDNQVQVFGDSFQVITMDLGGHGESSTNRKDYTVQAFGADVAALMNKLDLHNVIIVGHSMGGAVMIEAARQAPERVIALIGIDNLQELKQHFTPEQVAEVLKPLRDDFVGYSREYLRQLWMPWTDTLIYFPIVEEMITRPPEVGIPSISNVLTYDYATALKDVHVPIWCINSNRYPTDVAGNREVVDIFGVTIIRNIGHFPQIEEPKRFNEALWTTLRDSLPLVLPLEH